MLLGSFTELHNKPTNMHIQYEDDIGCRAQVLWSYAWLLKHNSLIKPHIHKDKHSYIISYYFGLNQQRASHLEIWIGNCGEKVLESVSFC